MLVITNPFFWASISLLGLVLAAGVVGSDTLRRSVSLGLLSVALFAVGRVILVLPYSVQPRLHLGAWHWGVAAMLFIAGLVFASPAILIKPFTGPDDRIVLRSAGLYRVVRNPLYLGELLWSAGLSLWFGSVVGLMLVPLWWLSLLILTLIEEENLERALCEAYRNYKLKVRGRIVPGLPK